MTMRGRGMRHSGLGGLRHQVIECRALVVVRLHLLLKAEVTYRQRRYAGHMICLVLTHRCHRGRVHRVCHLLFHPLLGGGKVLLMHSQTHSCSLSLGVFATALKL